MFGNSRYRQVQYWRTSNDGKGRFYAQGPAAQHLPKQIRHLLYGVTRLAIDIIGPFMTPYVAQLDSARSRPSQSCRLLCRQGLSSARTLKTSNPLADAGTIAKNVLHVAINASYAAVTWHLSDQNIRPGPTTPDLIIKLQQVATTGTYAATKL